LIVLDNKLVSCVIFNGLYESISEVVDIIENANVVIKVDLPSIDMDSKHCFVVYQILAER